jgi:hypothetical protein
VEARIGDGPPDASRGSPPDFLHECVRDKRWVTKGPATRRGDRVPGTIEYCANHDGSTGLRRLGALAEGAARGLHWKGGDKSRLALPERMRSAGHDEV